MDTTILERVCASIVPLDSALLDQARERLNRLTKPIGSLGRLETLAAQYVAMTGELMPPIPASLVVVMAADHGIAAEGVSAYPACVTRQMVQNFLRGGAAITVLARRVGATLWVVDMGVAAELGDPPGLITNKIGPGTKNFRYQPAMTRTQALAAIESGIALAQKAWEQGARLLAIGEMGIGNTTASAAIAAAMTGQPVREVTGHGTGIDAGTWERKVQLIEQALQRHRPDPRDPIDILGKVGGFEIGGLAGVILGAAARRMPVVLDGFITGASALLAVGFNPSCRAYLFASHRSVERGHEVILRHLDLDPLLDLDLRLGEGTGACLAINLIQAAIALYTGMATFDEAGVDGPVDSTMTSSFDS
ncbi:MAG: nicotinate-nucleotide--dimethylbenzimidazole phosphoribosyltransferase [Nitrospirae bacterium]|nr:MAG: nicotinate-nucleotide--dimethylbenzimidazole phosphoribosyltransferase [Nitrospirota bacterium]